MKITLKRITLSWFPTLIYVIYTISLKQSSLRIYKVDCATRKGTQKIIKWAKNCLVTITHTVGQVPNWNGSPRLLRSRWIFFTKNLRVSFLTDCVERVHPYKVLINSYLASLVTEFILLHGKKRRTERLMTNVHRYYARGYWKLFFYEYFNTFYLDKWLSRCWLKDFWGVS